MAGRSSSLPAYPAINPHDIPGILIEHPQWVVWRWVSRDGKYTKTPINPRTGKLAKTNVPETWGTFEEACDRAIAEGIGIGYVFNARDPFAGVDFDDCIDPETGELDPVALERIRALDSYAEVSPSGRGVKVIVLGKLPPQHRRNDAQRIEMYDDRRLFTITARLFAGAPVTIEPRQSQLDQLHAEVFAHKLSMPARAIPSDPGGSILSDEDVITKAIAARNGGRFVQLFWQGDTASYGGNHSAADLALCNILRYWTRGDTAQMDRLFRRSALMRDKWDKAARSGETYGEGTIREALSGDVWTPAPPPVPTINTPSTPLPSPPVDASPACAEAFQRVRELELEVMGLRAQIDQRDARIEQLEGLLRFNQKVHSVTERIHNNPGLKPAEGQIATNVVNEVASKMSTGQATDGWVLIRLDSVVKTVEQADPETGELIAKRVVSKQTASRYIDRLEEAGIWEVREEPRYDGGSPITDKYIRLLGEPTETLEKLASVVLNRPKHGGSVKGHRRCQKHPQAGVNTSRVTRCAECNDILEEQHIEHIPAVRFQDGTVDTDALVDTVPMGVRMEPAEGVGMSFQDETGRILERRQQLRRRSRVQHGTVARPGPIPQDVEDQIVAAVDGSPLDERGIAFAIGRPPRDVQLATDRLIQQRRLRRWDDGMLTPARRPTGSNGQVMRADLSSWLTDGTLRGLELPIYGKTLSGSELIEYARGLLARYDELKDAPAVVVPGSLTGVALRPAGQIETSIADLWRMVRSQLGYVPKGRIPATVGGGMLAKHNA